MLSHPERRASHSRRVALLIDRWQPRRGGAEALLADFGRELLNRGHDFVVCAQRADRDAPGRFVRVEPRRAWSTSSRALRLADALDAAAVRSGCDLTLGLRHLWRCDLYWPHAGLHAAGVAARARSRGREARPSARHAGWLELEHALLAQGGAGRVLCVSALVAAELAAAYPQLGARLELLPNAVDLERFHPNQRAQLGPALRRELCLAPETKLVACAAREPRLKGVPALFEALTRPELGEWSLVLSGPRDAWRWRLLARKAGLAARRVRVLPELDSASLLAAADLAVLPSWRDTCGLFVLEALASGVPAITTTAAGAAAWVARDPRAGSVLAEPGEAAALARAIAAQPLPREFAQRQLIQRTVQELGLGPWRARLLEMVESS